MVCTLVPTGWKGFIYEHCSSSERVTVTGVWVDMMRVERVTGRMVGKLS